MTSILIPYKSAIKVLGLSRAGFDRYVKPHVRSTKIGKRRLFSVQELEAFAMERLGGDNIGATDALRDEISRRAICQEKERPASVAGASRERGRSRRRSELEANRSDFARRLERVRSQRQKGTSRNESKSYA